MVNFLSEFSFYLLLLLILLPRLYIFIDCPNCVDESQYTPNKWTMPLLKLGEKRYYLGIFFKVSRIPWAIGHLQAARKLQLQQRSAICDATALTVAMTVQRSLRSVDCTYCIWYFTSKTFKKIKAKETVGEAEKKRETYQAKRSFTKYFFVDYNEIWCNSS